MSSEMMTVKFIVLAEDRVIDVTKIPNVPRIGEKVSFGPTIYDVVMVEWLVYHDDVIAEVHLK